eukprot:TRINITY_DN3845_c0_g1_i1.p1 TRINITY_DN3845_c0_g1~~TRINITY_DN3845_c0_g1_i1.p1  ORF type:complete len:1088 (+),score=593.45 TRINITY_DN3845_c0_g1_i1:90-3353(+)
MSHAQIEVYVNQLLSDNNEIRTQAEAAYKEAKNTAPEAVAGTLLALAKGSPSEPLRDMASVLLRQLVRGTNDFWVKLSAPVQEHIKGELLLMVHSERSALIRPKICDIIAELGIHILGDETPGEWKNLLPALFELTKSAEDFHRESALDIFTQLISFLTEQMRPYFAVLNDIFLAGLKDSSPAVRLQALKAFMSFIIVLPEDCKQQRAQFQQFIPLMLENLQAFLASGNVQQSQSALEQFIEAAEMDSSFFRPYLVQVFNAMMTVATAPQIDSELRTLGLEFFITVAENRPAMLRKLPEFVTALIDLLLKQLTTIEDNDDWNEGEEEDADDQEASVAEENIDRLAMKLGGATVGSILFAKLPAYFNSTNWKHRHAALIAISVAVEGCCKFLTPHLADILKLVVPRFADENPRVRWAACNAIGQMANDFGAPLQNKFHAEIIPSLIAVLNDTQNPRVQSHAASAIINYCDGCKVKSLTPYLDGLVNNLINVLRSATANMVLEQCITAVASIADTIGEEFVKYAEVFVPYLKGILLNANQKNQQVLRAKALECLSLIGVAIGKEKFGAEAKAIMDLLLNIQWDPENPQMNFQLQAWARFCKCLGNDFVPYLPMVMPALIKSATCEPEVQIFNGVPEQEGWEVVPVGDKTVGIKTSMLEEKSTACHMLFCYADELGAGFFPHVEEISKVMVPLLKFYYHDGVRQAAAETLPCLLNCSKAYFKNQGFDVKSIQPLWGFIFPALVEAIPQETDSEVLTAMLSSFSECVEFAGDLSLNHEQLKKSVDLISTLIDDYHERAKDRLESAQDQDFDVEERERLEEEREKEGDILTDLVDLISSFIKTHKDIFFNVFNEIVPKIIDMLQPGKDTHDRQVAVCIFDDIIEHGGPAGLNYLQHFAPLVIQYMHDTDSGVRQSALYGVGICAQFCGETFAPAVPECINRLTVVINDPNAKTDENVHSTENAVSAFGKIIRYQTASLQSQNLTIGQALTYFLSQLPVTEDEFEAKTVYENLCFFLEDGRFNQHAVDGGNNIPKIVTLFADVLDTDLVSDETTSRIGAIMKNLIANLPQATMQHIFATLSEEQKAKLQKVCA